MGGEGIWEKDRQQYKLQRNLRRQKTVNRDNLKAICSDVCSDQIMRVVELPVDVETDKVTAKLKNGVLNLELPKAAKAHSIRVEPKVVT